MSLIWNRITPSQERSMRLKLLLSKIEKSLRKKYHEKFPKNPTLLYDYLNKNHLNDINKLLNKNIIKQDQYDLLFPPNQKQTDSSKFDATLLLFQLRSLWFKKPPKGKTWNEWPDNNDNSDAAHLVRIRLIRNQIQHAQEDISKNEFDDIFNKVVPSIIAFGCKPEEIDNIKTCKLQRNTFSFKELISVVVVIFAIYFGYLYVSEHPTQKSFNIQNVSPSFFGRESEIEVIHTNLTTKHQYKGVVLHGMSGVGKSQIAKRYCQQFGNHYANNIAWFHSPNAFTIEKSMGDFAELLGFQIQGKKIAHIKEKVYKYFSKTNALIVFDDVVNTTDIIPFLPNAFQKNINVLITSQIASWDNHYFKIPIRVFSKETAMKFLRSVFEKISEKDAKHLEYIADTLQYHPLALQQAVSYIKGSKFELIDYIRLLNESFNDLMSEPCDEIEMDCKPVLKAINLTVTLFQSQASKDSIKIIHDMTFLDGANIRRGFYKHVYYNISDLKMNRMLKSMEKFSLITITQKDNSSKYFQNKYVEIHSLVQRVIEMNLKMKGSQFYENYIQEFFFELVNATFTNQSILSNLPLLKYTRKHFLFILEKDELAKVVITSLTFNKFFVLFQIYPQAAEYKLEKYQRLSDLAEGNRTALNYLKMMFVGRIYDSEEIVSDFVKMQKYWRDRDLWDEYYFNTLMIVEYYDSLHDRENLKKILSKMNSFCRKRGRYSNYFCVSFCGLLKDLPLGRDISEELSFKRRCDTLKRNYLSHRGYRNFPELLRCLLNINQSIEALKIIEDFERSSFSADEEFEQQNERILGLKIASLVFLNRWENVTNTIYSSVKDENKLSVIDTTYSILSRGCNSFRGTFTEKFKTVSKEASKSYYNEVIRRNKSNNDTRTVVLYFNLIMMKLYYDHWLPENLTFIEHFSSLTQKLSEKTFDRIFQNKICDIHVYVIYKFFTNFNNDTLQEAKNTLDIHIPETSLNLDFYLKKLDFIEYYNKTYSSKSLNLPCDDSIFYDAMASYKNLVFMASIKKITLFTNFIQTNKGVKSLDEKYILKKFKELEHFNQTYFQAFSKYSFENISFKTEVENGFKVLFSVVLNQDFKKKKIHEKFGIANSRILAIIKRVSKIPTMKSNILKPEIEQVFKSLLKEKNVAKTLIEELEHEVNVLIGRLKDLTELYNKHRFHEQNILLADLEKDLTKLSTQHIPQLKGK